MSDIDELTPKIDDLEVNDAVEATNWNHLPFEMKEMIVKEMDLVARIRLQRCSKSDYCLVGSLKNHFKTSTPNWNDMPIETKEMIVKEMNLITRARLKQCSKSDEQLVELIPNHFSRVFCRFHIDELPPRCDCHPDSFEDQDQEAADLPTLHFQFAFDDVVVSRYLNDLLIMDNSKKRIIPMNHLPKVFKSIQQRFLDIMTTEKITIDEFFPEWVCPDDYPPSFINAKQVYFFEREADLCLGWLDRLAPGVEHVEVEWGRSRTERLTVDFGSHPIIINAKTVRIDGGCLVNDDEVVNFIGTNIQLFDTHITEIGVNNMIKKWINDDYPVDSYFCCDNCREVEKRDIKQVINGLEYTVERDDMDGMIVDIRMNEKKGIKLRCSQQVTSEDVKRFYSLTEDTWNVFFNFDVYEIMQ